MIIKNIFIAFTLFVVGAQKVEAVRSLTKEDFPDSVSGNNQSTRTSTLPSSKEFCKEQERNLELAALDIGAELRRVAALQETLNALSVTFSHYQTTEKTSNPDEFRSSVLEFRSAFEAASLSLLNEKFVDFERDLKRLSQKPLQPNEFDLFAFQYKCYAAGHYQSLLENEFAAFKRSVDPLEIARSQLLSIDISLVLMNFQKANSSLSLASTIFQMAVQKF